MRLFLILLVGAITVSAVGVLFIRDQALRRAAAAEHRLELPATDRAFDEAMLASLPESARRYLRHAIAPGTLLARSVRLTMSGEYRLSQGGPLSPFSAEEVLATPEGFLWRATIGTGLQRRTGFDLYAEGRARRRWWLAGVLPIVNDEGRAATRSESARVALEAIWLPSALLPERDVTWFAGDTPGVVRARMVVDGDPHELALTVSSTGMLERVETVRWDPTARQGEGDEVPFVVDGIQEERTFEGFTIPTRLRVGWHRGEHDVFDYYFPVVESARYTPPAPPPPPPPTPDAGVEAPPDGSGEFDAGQNAAADATVGGDAAAAGIESPLAVDAGAAP